MPIISESIIIERGSRLYDLVWKAFRYSNRSCNFFYTKKVKQRFQQHADALIRHAHWQFERELEYNGITGWSKWKISIVGKSTIREFDLQIVDFKFDKVIQDNM